MQKEEFGLLLLLFLVVFSPSTYSYLSESEKSEFEKCPLNTYVNVSGNGIYSIGCKDVVIEKGFDRIYIKTICDDYTVVSFVNTNEGLRGNAIKEGGIWKLHDFRAKANPYFLSCVINKTKLEDIKHLWVYVKTRSELESEEREKEISKNIGLLLNNTKNTQLLVNKTDILINKSDEVIKELNDSKNLLGSINTTTQQTNTTLTIIQKSQNCKEKFCLWPEVLGIVLEIIFVFIGFTNKRNEKLRRRLWIIAAIVIILVIIARLIITFFICNY